MINCKRSKIWGSTRCIFADNNVEIHRAEIVKNGYCSTHKHINKWNIFFVEAGELKIIINRQDAGQEIRDETILKPGDMTFVEPGFYHYFEAIEETIVYEIYYTKLNLDDIERLTIGGVKGVINK